MLKRVRENTASVSDRREAKTVLAMSPALVDSEAGKLALPRDEAVPAGALILVVVLRPPPVLPTVLSRLSEEDCDDGVYEV